MELTRNPVGLARALRTIADDPEVLEVANRATQHLYIVNPIKSFENRAKSMWDTHPPIAERIAVLRASPASSGRTRAGSPGWRWRLIGAIGMTVSVPMPLRPGNASSGKVSYVFAEDRCPSSSSDSGSSSAWSEGSWSLAVAS